MCPFCFYFCIQIMLKTDMEDKKSLAGAWVEAARPRTLPASVSCPAQRPGLHTRK